MQSDFAQPPAPKLLADTPTNLRLFATEEVEKDSMDHRLLSRGAGFHDDVERDMMRSTPTTPGSSSSSSFPSAPPTSDSKGAGPSSLTIRDLKPRGPHVISGTADMGGGGGGGYHSSSSSSLGSLSSPTESCTSAPGGVADFTSQPQQLPPDACARRPVVPDTQPVSGQVQLRRPREQAGASDGGGGVSVEQYNAQLRYSGGGDTWGQGLGQSSGQTSAQLGIGATAQGQGQFSAKGPSVQPGQGRQFGQGQLAEGQLSGQGPWPSGQGQPLAQGQVPVQGQVSRPSTLEGNTVRAQPNEPQGQHSVFQPTGQGGYGDMSLGPPGQSQGYRGQLAGHRDYQTLPLESTGYPDYRRGGSGLEYLPPAGPDHTSLRVGGVVEAPPLSLHQPHPSHFQAPPPPPAARLHQHHQIAYPPSHPHHAHPLSSGHTHPHYEPPEPVGMHSGGWSQHYMPHPPPSSSYSQSSSSEFSPTDTEYRYLGAGGSHDPHLSSLYSSSAYSHSSLGSLSEVGRQPQYSYQRPAGSLAQYDDERCHSFPLDLSQTSVHRHWGRQEPGPHPQAHQLGDIYHRVPPQGQQYRQQYPPQQQQQQHGRYDTLPAGPVSQKYPSSSSEEALSSELASALTLSEDTPSGQSMTSGSEAQGATSDTKHALLTALDSDRINITEQPKDLKVALHARAVLTCRARALDSEAAPKLQWYRGEERLVGETSAELVVEDMGNRDGGLYWCVVTHPEDETARKCSYVAQLAIRTRPADEGPPAEREEPRAPVIIEQPPAKIYGVIGEELKLALKVKGEEPLSFKWYKDTCELDYISGPVLLIPKAIYTDSGQYCCSVSNIHGSRLSGSIDVQVSRIRDVEASSSQGKGEVQRQQPPASHFDWEGTNISDAFLREIALAIAQSVSNWKKLVTYLGLANSDLLEVRGQSSRPEDHALKLLYRWREKNRESRAILKKRLERGGVDFEVLENSMPGGQVQGVEHMVVAKPDIAVQPQSQEVVYGQEFSLSVDVRPSPSPCSFQWFKNYLHLHGKTEPKLLIKSAVESDAGEYYCTTYNKGGASDSDIAFVKVVNPHPRPQPAEAHKAAPPPSLSYWPAEGKRRLPPSLGGRSISVGPPASRVSGQPPGQYSMVEGAVRQGYGEENRPRSWVEGTVGASIEGLVGRGTAGGVLRPPGAAKAAAAAYMSRRGSGPSGLLESSGEKPRILLHPQSQTVDAGDPLTLTCAATGLGDLSYLWYFNGLSLQNESRPKYFINCFTDEDEGVYFCKVGNIWGEVSTNMAHVQMKDD